MYIIKFPKTEYLHYRIGTKIPQCKPFFHQNILLTNSESRNELDNTKIYNFYENKFMFVNCNTKLKKIIKY